jgi:hypothetical protein
LPGRWATTAFDVACANIGAFFEAKRAIDPDGILTNTFYEKYQASFS